MKEGDINYVWHFDLIHFGAGQPRDNLFVFFNFYPCIGEISFRADLDINESTHSPRAILGGALNMRSVTPPAPLGGVLYLTEIEYSPHLHRNLI